MKSLHLYVQAAALALISVLVLASCNIPPQIPCVDPNCPQCRGHGNYRCTTCSGRGRTQCNVCNGRGMTGGVGAAAVNCWKCQGQGMANCLTCNGTGMVRCFRPAPQANYGPGGYPAAPGYPSAPAYPTTVGGYPPTNPGYSTTSYPPTTGVRGAYGY